MEQLNLRTRIRYQKTIAYLSVLRQWVEVTKKPKALGNLVLLDKQWIKEFGEQAITKPPSPEIDILEWLELEVVAVEIFLEEENRKLTGDPTGKELLTNGLIRK
jgi:hypothetical protein